MNEFENDVQSKNNDVVDSGLGFVYSFVFFVVIFFIGVFINFFGQ
ncbi:YqzM family protein [Virgibacillus phasianinus]|uniref:YqzM family protein n=1 Tax=Virgibacillus phasianinus TaxID=2017483 RepID=A0A220U500_9BACI|nr:YqzM family protein [Virgibacillus phasianinus]ASK63135.1 YqzM family protein [Virgibacillus phasianinus]